MPRPYKGGDASRGEKLAQQRAGQCHSFCEGAANGVGPNLYNIVGRTSGTQHGYVFSKANHDAAITWTPEVLDEYLANPRKYMPGTKMLFSGLKKDKDRADLISYLQTLKV